MSPVTRTIVQITVTDREKACTKCHKFNIKRRRMQTIVIARYGQPSYLRHDYTSVGNSRKARLKIVQTVRGGFLKTCPPLCNAPYLENAFSSHSCSTDFQVNLMTSVYLGQKFPCFLKFDCWVWVW